MFDAESPFAQADTTAPALRPSRALYANYGKRVFDLLFVVAFAPLLLPVIAVIAVLVSLDGGPAFFGHRRIGRHGRIFACWKLRTMVVDADARLAEHLLNNPADNAYWQVNFKLVNDPRITRLGRFLRKTSLDELPQFWNVLIGDMSVVGPRPVTPKELALYGSAARMVNHVKPGVTGLWQVSGRSATSYDQRIHMDVTYVTKMNFLDDVKIILKTVLVVLRRTGR